MTSTDGAIAGLARKLVAERVESTQEHKNETAYRSLCEGLPVLLRTAGLTRTLAFLEAKRKSGPEYKAILEHFEKQFDDAGVFSGAKWKDPKLLEWVTSPPRRAEYRHVSALAFQVAYWHKRLAQALLRSRENETKAAR